MAEIKSTMDLVMERAARIGKASSEELRFEEARKKGMHLAVEYLDGSLVAPLEALKEQENSLQIPALRGMAEIMLRNIFLPRDETQKDRTEKAVKGVMALEGESGEIEAICNELVNLLGGYMQHRVQLRAQLEEQVAQQSEMQKQGAQVDPAQQPKVHEEWSRIETELSTQYNAALDQLKQQVGQRFGID
jgi:hypothetical protein